MRQACAAAGHGRKKWRDRLLPPWVVPQLFALQILSGNVACRAVARLSELAFTAQAYCKARAMLPVDVLGYIAAAMGLRGMGEVKANFRCWATHPSCHSLRAEHASHTVDNVCRFSPAFRGRKKDWQRLKIKDVTRGPMVWEVKAARVWLVNHDERKGRSIPTDRQYWLIVARQPSSGEIKYFVSNAPGSVELLELMRVGFSRWHIEKWFERGKQEAGLGSFEVRTYRSLIRHWICCEVAMWFLAEQTARLRGGKSADHAGTGEPGDQRPDAPSAERLVELVA